MKEYACLKPFEVGRGYRFQPVGEMNILACRQSRIERKLYSRGRLKKEIAKAFPFSDDLSRRTAAGLGKFLRSDKMPLFKFKISKQYH